MQGDELKTKVARGTAVNFIGVLAKLLNPIFFIAMTRVYGPSVMGVYLLANTVVELSISFTFSGFQVGVLMFSSRHVHSEEERGLVYRVMANAVAIALGLTALAIVLAYTAAPPIFAAKFQREGLTEAVQIMALALPFLALPQIIVAGTKSLMIMKWDVILLGGLRPGLLLVFSVVLFFFDPSVTGLAWAFLGSNVVVTAVALWVFTRHFVFSRLLAEFRPLRLHRPLITYAIPQSLNQTLVFFTAGISVLMLGTWEVSKATIAFFATGAEMVRQIKQARIAFSMAFMPVISRLHQERRLDELREQFSMVSRWVITVNIPLLLLVLSVKEPLLLLFHETYVWDSGFLYFLAASTFLGGLLGLSANVVSMTGHSTMNMVNALVVGTTCFVLNWFMIPLWGLHGAALATALAATTNLLLTTTEIWVLYRIVLRPGAVAKPLLAGAAGVVAYVLAAHAPLDGLLLNGLKAVASLGAYLGILFTLGIEAQDREILRNMVSRKRA